ncbi:Txe/YoeB family addiction module toxin [Flavobacterium gilvum]|uniref:Putative mRNA interferase YoeB n=1 Tax=Flavobacterium gilvum TaxID=1492737 RepID=A0AAC9N4L2_9FLAO|nr:Txe/YoeB family addiction module toxin [Flavobacterium gilvum]AOW08052.1 addiction module toxin YoeB [Flavobacterium gilvum]KFC57754.1 addiction module toxin YoeB [Flavobacterium gilvum]
MGKYFVEFEDVARKNLKAHYKSGNKSTIKKIEKILLELTESPFSGEGQPEELKYNLEGYWSRRINKKDRIVYRVEAEIVTVFVVSAMGHYFDK